MSEREKQTPEQWAVTLRRRCFIWELCEAGHMLKLSTEERAAIIALAELIERGNEGKQLNK